MRFCPPCIIAFLDIMIINEFFKQFLCVFSLLSCHPPAAFLLTAPSITLNLLECVVVAVLVLPDLEPRVVPAPADDGDAVGGVEVVGVAELQPLQQRQRALDREEGGGSNRQ